MSHRFVFAACAVALELMFACTTPKPKEYQQVDGFTQGTTFSIVYYDSLQRNFAPQFDSIFRVIDNSMSIYNDSSIISRINRNECSAIDSMLAEVIAISDSVYHQTGGAFDITVGPVVRAIGFGKDKTQGIDSAKVRSLLPLIGMHQLRVEGMALIKSNPNIQIDVNAVAQGYTSDVVARFLQRKGIRNYLVEVGGEIVARGVNRRGDLWVVGLDKPVENAMPGENVQVKIKLSHGRGLATSGNYRKFIEVNGVKYAHTVNPKTGFPILNSLLSATVIAPTAAQADAIATAFMVRGVDWSIRYVDANPHVDAYLIYSDSSGRYNVWVNDRLRNTLVE